MDQLTKVIDGIEICVQQRTDCYNCPYDDTKGLECIDNLRRDTLALLKAQEPVKPYVMYSEHTGTKWLTCGACNQPMIKMTPDAVYPNYCPECGKKVWWE